MTSIRRVLLLALVLAAALATAIGAAAGPHFSPWSTAQKIDEIAGNDPELNTPSLDGCPMESPDGLNLYMASNRPGSAGLDIWVAHRMTKDAPFGAPVNLGSAVNSAADDFCPTPVGRHGLFFVSRRTIEGVTCGLGDIYFTRFDRAHGWRPPEHLGCAPDGPNSALDEMGPSYVKTHGQKLLYFSSSSAAVPGDIFVSAKAAGGTFGPASPVAALNSAGHDIQPNVRKDGLEVVFSSNREGSLGQDIWVSVRDHADDPWSAPVRLGSEINTALGETRPSLSRNGQRLYFGRTPGPEGMTDIFLASREQLES
jgi:hypothetical protein